MKRPRIYPTTSYENLSSYVKRGEYHLYDKKHNIPQELGQAGAFPSTDDFRATLLMASSTSENPPSIGGIAPASSSPIYRVSVFRADIHSNGIPHLNKDDVLIFADKRGENWCMKATNKNRDHFVVLMKDSGLDSALNIHNLPPQCHGKLTDLKYMGATVNFSTGDPAKST